MGMPQEFFVSLRVTTDPEVAKRLTEERVKRILKRILNSDRVEDSIEQIIVTDVIERTKRN